jgi:uncharacterized membrane protein
MAELWAIGLVILGTILGAFGPIFFKKASKDFSLNILKLIKNYNLIFGSLSYAVGTFLFIPALKGGELSVLYPFVSLVYIWVSLLSIWILKEKMNKFKWFGILLIIIGVSFIGFGS